METVPFAHGRQLAAATLVLSVMLTACGGAQTQPTGEWLEATYAEDLSAFGDAMTEATSNVAPGATAPPKESCDAMVDWADDADSHPRPEDTALADAWENFIASGRRFGAEVCTSGDTEKILEHSQEMNAAIAAIEEAIKAA